MKTDKKRILVIILLLINMTATIILMSMFVLHINAEKVVCTTSVNSSKTIDFKSSPNGKYTLYIGTNDKKTYKQIIPTEKAREIVNKICVKYVDGYTSLQACGGWVDETNTLTQENTLVYSFYDVTQQQIVSILNEVEDKLNQNSILVEVEDVNYAYYYGDN